MPDTCEPVVYDLFGHFLELRCSDPGIVEALTAKESNWKPLLSDERPAEPDVVVEVLIHPPPSPLTEVQHFSNERFFFHGSRSRLLTGYLYTRPWQIHVQSFVEDRATTLDNMIFPTLSNVLLRLGLVNVHCAAVAHKGRGLLIVGPSRAGKSTTALRLAHAGLDFLTDNDVYLRRDGEAVVALSGNKELFLLDDSTDPLRRLDLARDLPIRNRGGTPKRVLDMQAELPGQCIGEAKARVVLFPEVGGSASTVLEPLAPQDCLERLMSLVPARGLPAQIKDRKALELQFDLLSSLAVACEAYRVRLGSDPAELVDKLAALV